MKLLGTHNGIQLIQKEDGTEMYYSTKTNKAAIGIKGLARLLGCNTKLIAQKSGYLNLGKSLEMYTTGGVKVVTLIMEDELNTLLDSIRESRCKKETRQRAKEVQSKYVQAGFRLQVLLEVAPEVVAKAAINKIEDADKARDVSNHAEQHAEYLDTFKSLGDEIKANQASYGAIHGHNNKLLDIPNGTRPKMDKDTKDKLIIIQTMERLKLASKRGTYKNGFHATNSAKKAGTQAKQSIDNILA